MNLKHAEYVLAILREGSITAAAKSLNISQPSLSQTVKQIEAKLGTPIFIRGKEPLELTLAGLEYEKAARQVMAIHAGLLSRIREIKDEVHGTMRLGISMQLGMYLLPKVLPEFSARYPRVRVKLVEYGSVTLERLLVEGACDIALMMTAPKDNGLAYTLVKRQQLVLMAAVDTDIARRIPDGMEIELSEAAGERFVSLRHGHSVRTVQDQLFARSHIEPETYLESDSVETAKNITASAGAVMLCPYVHIVNAPGLRERVHCYPVRSDGYDRHLYLCHKADMYFANYMEAFLAIVKGAV